MKPERLMKYIENATAGPANPLPTTFVADEHLPKVIPDGWSEVSRAEDGALYVSHRAKQSVILSFEVKSDGRIWTHASIAGRKKLPSWEAIKMLKDYWIGTWREAYLIYPAEARYINDHPFCIHLWSPLDGNPALPDMTSGRGTI